MNSSLLKGSAALAAALALSAPLSSKADVISLNSLLTNASFEGGLAGNGCPTGWTCLGSNVSWTVAIPTSTEYPDPNGLAAGTYVPDGSYAALTPTSSTSSGAIAQQTTATYKAGDTYVLEFWLGNPLSPSNAQNTGYPGTVTVALTINGINNVATSMCDSGRTATLVSGSQSSTVSGNNTPCQFSVSTAAWMPTDGDWRFYTLTYDPHGAALNGPIGVYFNVSAAGSGANGWALNLDVAGAQPTTAVPEPATLGLLALGLAGLGLAARRVRRSEV